MIITITGKPCSGKGTVSKIFCNKHNFKYVCTGDMMREYAKQYGYNSVLDFQVNEKENLIKVDQLIDSNIKSIGETSLNENIVIDSRLAWHFVPKSFKVFVDVSWPVAGKRLFEANRSNEQANDEIHATEILQKRWAVENDRYTNLYNTNNHNLDNYDLVINSDNLSPDEIADEIYEKYLEFMQQA